MMMGEVKDYNQMKKILFLLLILLPTGAWADLFTANILVNGKATPAEFVTIGDPNNYQCILGNGRNACISQYSAGSVTVPAYVHDKNKLYYVMGINAMAFRLCDKITSVDIQEETLHGGFEHMTVGTRSIGNFAFVGCSSLKEVELPATLKTIGSGAFINLPNLTKVKCNATTPPTWEYNDVFYFHADGIGTTETPIYNIQLFVPDAAKAAYSSSTFSNPSLGWNTPEGWANFITVSGSHDAKATLRIQNAKELIAFRDAINSGIDIRLVELEADIDMSGEEAWTSAIGNTDEHPFRGTFNGNGHTISGLQVTASYAGLFGRIRDAKINNLVIKDCTFTGTDAAGAVCGRTSGSATQAISGVYAEGNVIQHAVYCGGLVGHGGNVLIQRSVVDRGSIIADGDTEWIGGILGWAYVGFVNYCALFDTNLTKGNSKTGDIIAGNNEGTYGYVKQCFSTWGLGECGDNWVRHEGQERNVYSGMEYN